MSAIGVWIGKDLAANDREIANAITMANAGEADMVIVGSEVLLRYANNPNSDAVDPAALRSYIAYVKARVPRPAVVVTCADTYGRLLANPAIIAESDVVMANIFPFWERVPVTAAVSAVHQAYQSLRDAAPGDRKSVV